MDIAKKIKMAAACAGIKEAELASRVGSSPQAFNQRMKSKKWDPDDLERIAEALGAEVVLEFRFPDGTVI